MKDFKCFEVKPTAEEFRPNINFSDLNATSLPAIDLASIFDVPVIPEEMTAPEGTKLEGQILKVKQEASNATN